MPSRPSGETIAERRAGRIGYAVAMRKGHRARVERRDLVVVDVGGDEGLGGELVLEDAHVASQTSPRDSSRAA